MRYYIQLLGKLTGDTGPKGRLRQCENLSASQTLVFSCQINRGAHSTSQKSVVFKMFTGTTHLEMRRYLT